MTFVSKLDHLNFRSSDIYKLQKKIQINIIHYTSVICCNNNKSVITFIKKTQECIIN